jgi:hypothetical protein
MLCVGLAAAQEAETCPAIVETALQSLDALCQGAARNQACYGHRMLMAEAQPDVTDFQFDTPGDITPVSTIRALHLQALDEADSAWGVALLRLQANLPDTLPGQNVTVLLFGDVTLRAAEDAGGLVPMQAFYFRSGMGDSQCTEVPESGILIQSPGEGGPVELTINDVSVELGSTAFLQSNAENGMTLFLLEGQARVTAFEVEQVVPAGTKLTIPVDEDMHAAGPPSAMEVFAADEVSHLSGIVQSLPENVPVVPDFTYTQMGVSGCESGELAQMKPGEWVKLVQAVYTAATLEEAQALLNQAYPITMNGGQLPTYFAPVAQTSAGFVVEVYAWWQVSSGGHNLQTTGENGQTSCDFEIAPEPDENPAGVCTLAAGGTVNLRSGPGTEYARAATLAAGQGVQPVGQAASTDGQTWWQLADGNWVRSDVVSASGDCASLPVITDLPPTPEPPPTSVPGSSNLPHSIIFHPWGCDVGSAGAGNTGAARAGTITFYHGVGGFNSCEEAFAAVGDSFATWSPAVSVNPQRDCTTPDQGTAYGAVTTGYVTLTPGTYTYDTNWIHGARTCTFRVE